MSVDSHCQDTAVRRRKTPRQQRGQETLDALVAATASLMDEVGYEQLTTKAIAARAGPDGRVPAVGAEPPQMRTWR